MSFNKGDKFDTTGASFQFIRAKGQEPTSLDLVNYKQFVLVGFPAAFSPPCSEQHIPAYIGHLKEFTEKGYTVILISNDNVFSLGAYSKQLNAFDKQDDIFFASDIGLKYIKKLGLSTTEFGDVLGEVSSRFALAVKDGVVQYFGKEKEIGTVDVSSAEKVLSSL